MSIRKNLKSDLCQKRLKELLSYDEKTGIFTRIKTSSLKIKPGIRAGGINALGYEQIAVDGKVYLAHRLAWLYHYGCWPKSDIDHINGNPSDNRISNIRAADPAENLCNRGKQKNNTSGYKNVSWSKTMMAWMVRINKNRKSFIVGYFADKKSANEAAKAAREKYHGDFSIDKRTA